MSDNSSDNDSTNDQDQLPAESITKEIDDLIAEKNSDFSESENTDHLSDSSEDETSDEDEEDDEEDDIDGYFSEELNIKPNSRARVRFNAQSSQSRRTAGLSRNQGTPEYDSSEDEIDDADRIVHNSSGSSYDEYELSQEEEPYYLRYRSENSDEEESSNIEDEQRQTRQQQPSHTEQIDEPDKEDDFGIDNISQKMRELFTSDEESSDYPTDVSLEVDNFNDSEGDLNDENHTKRKKPPGQLVSSINEGGRVFLNLAQKEYEAHNLKDAVLLIEEAILEDPRSRLPYILLDVIHTDMRNPEAALNAKILAATAGSIFPDDWEDVAYRSMELGLYSQAITFTSVQLVLTLMNHHTALSLLRLIQSLEISAVLSLL